MFSMNVVLICVRTHEVMRPTTATICDPGTFTVVGAFLGRVIPRARVPLGGWTVYICVVCIMYSQRKCYSGDALHVCFM